jgi:triacylglycerol lipase
MPFNPQIAIQLYYPAANAAYLIQTVPNPPLPDGFALAGPLVADPQKAAAMMAQASPQQHTMVNAMLAESNIFGLVAWNAGQKTAMIAFRGTQDAKDWLDDLDAALVDYRAVPGIGLAHMGFQLVYEHVRASLTSLIQTKCAGAQNISITGHSLGGAVAVLAGFDVARNIAAGPVPEFCTFAGPRAVDPVNFMDVVPQVPLPPLYEHVGQEQLVHGGFKPLDPVYAHRLTAYLAGLQKLVNAASG